MSTSEGGGPGDEQGRDQERRRTPPPRRRTPPPRSSRAGREGGEANESESSGGSIFSRIFGRQGLDKALEERFKPYDYKSTRPQLRWVFLGLLAFIAVGIYALVVDLEFRGTINEWRDEGLTALPPDKSDMDRALIIASLEGDPVEICAAEREAVTPTPTPEVPDPNATPVEDAETPATSFLLQGCDAMDRVFAYGVEHGFDCSTPDQLASVVEDTLPDSPGCERLVDYTRDYDSLVGQSNVATVLMIIVILITAFPFSSFLHQSSRNLRTLKSQGQRHSPDGVVIRFIVPFVNLYKPLFIFKELFKASDPRMPEGDTTAWQKRGAVHPLAIIYGLIWPAFLLFNQITVAQIWSRGQRGDLADLSRVTTQLTAADALVIALGIVAILTAHALSRWQQARAERHGTVTVTPPRPKDPLERALEEGTRRADALPADSDSSRSRRRRGKR